MDSDEQRQAMTAERLAEIRKRWSEREYGQLDVSGRYRNAGQAGPWNYWIVNAAADEGELLAEVERLRAREAALVAVVERVAASADGNMVMCLCDKSEWLPSATTIAWPVERSMVLHVPDCVFAQARAALAAGEQAQGEA